MTALLVGIGIGLGLFVGVSIIMRPRPALPLKTLRQLDRLALGNVLDGERCKVSGELRYGPKTLRAPVSGRTCAYYAVRIEVQHAGARGGWETLVRDTGGCDFLIANESSVARVDVQGADVTLVKDFRRISIDDIDQTIAKEFVDQYGDTLAQHAGEARVLEGVLEQGEIIAVAGYADSEADPSSQAVDYRAPAKRVVIRMTPEVPLYISDDPRGID